MDKTKKFVWEDNYNTGIELIDSQHQRMFEIMNDLLDLLLITPTKEQIREITTSLIQYKRYHFATEEKYFQEFNYEKTKDHVAIHQWFDEKIKETEEKYADDPAGFAYEIIDFLEDWFLKHIMTTDKQYVACFKNHGLK